MRVTQDAAPQPQASPVKLDELTLAPSPRYPRELKLSLTPTGRQLQCDVYIGVHALGRMSASLSHCYLNTTHGDLDVRFLSFDSTTLFVSADEAEAIRTVFKPLGLSVQGAS